MTLSFTIFSGQKNYNRAHMLFQVLCGFEPIFYTTHPNEESYFFTVISVLSNANLGFIVLFFDKELFVLLYSVCLEKRKYN